MRHNLGEAVVANRDHLPGTTSSTDTSTAQAGTVADSAKPAATPGDPASRPARPTREACKYCSGLSRRLSATTRSDSPRYWRSSHCSQRPAPGQWAARTAVSGRAAPPRGGLSRRRRGASRCHGLCGPSGATGWRPRRSRPRRQGSADATPQPGHRDVRLRRVVVTFGVGLIRWAGLADGLDGPRRAFRTVCKSAPPAKIRSRSMAVANDVAANRTGSALHNIAGFLPVRCLARRRSQ